MSESKLGILLVEDDDVAAESVERGLRKSSAEFDFVHAEDGVEALEIMRGEHPAKSLKVPYLVLLDLNMPRMNGLEFLENIRADNALHRTVVFVLTTSDDETDRCRAYDHNIAGYMLKSAVGPQMHNLSNLLADYGRAIYLP